MKERDLHHAHHISQQFNTELDEIKTRMLEMGGLVEKQVADATTAFMLQDTGMAEEVKKGDRLVNALEVSIDEECTIILARRQPAASDLRLVLSISKTLSDLERMGDEASKVADSSIKLSELGGLPRSVLEIRHIGDHVTGMVRSALDAFARVDVDLALQVAEEDNAVDMEYGTAMRSLVTYMMEDPRTISSVLQVMWALRSLERIGDHARNIAEHVIYLVKGADVRHAGIDEMAATVQQQS
ncbi:phosphate signaling complex protein PhoU [Spongiibacter taiwanensis]|uniref:phosphate signaling complex protein PhoU n=1 Tax=Spongiibacter taiwanensis TaxID=1748242 RepID=UPI002035D834|nr:phosphate signaling complex protein PhoU [Spongiibacter taiwanensis]USA43253.1 phosphate signaling complex protein PhoU [Spongiibacter taiwanensis]